MVLTPKRHLLCAIVAAAALSIFPTTHSSIAAPGDWETKRAIQPAIGHVNSANGPNTVVRFDGAIATLKVGDAVYVSDVVQTAAGGHVGFELADGTTVTLGETGELYIDSFAFDPKARTRKATVGLVKGVAELNTGTAAMSKKDQVVLKTPTATLNMHDAKAVASYDLNTGETTFLNRDYRPNHAGDISLTLPNQMTVGKVADDNNGWQWAMGRPPQPIQFTEAQVQKIVAPLGQASQTE